MQIYELSEGNKVSYCHLLQPKLELVYNLE